LHVLGHHLLLQRHHLLHLHLVCGKKLLLLGHHQLRQNFGSTSPLFSKYTSWKRDCVPGEQQECEAETLSQIEADHGN
jgi:hypothetical protein